MKRYALLRLENGGNKGLEDRTCRTEAEAIGYFMREYPWIGLNDQGYAKHGDISYCVAVYFSS